MHYLNRLIALLLLIVVSNVYAYNFCGVQTDYTAMLNTPSETYENNGTVVRQNNVQVTEDKYYITLEEPGYVEINITSPSGKVFFAVDGSACYDPNANAADPQVTSTTFHATDTDFNIVVYPIDPTGANNQPYPYTITVKYITVRDAYLAADICYAEIIDLGNDTNTTIPVRNISDTNLTDVTFAQDNTALPITNANIVDCGIDGTSGNCEEISSTTIGLVEYIPEGLKWDLGDVDYNTSRNVFEILDAAIALENWSLPNVMFTTYKKDGIIYTGGVRYCPSGSSITPGIIPPLKVDIVDTPAYILDGTRSTIDTSSYNDGTDKVIQTKVSGDNLVSFTAVHLDGAGNAVPYSSTEDVLQVLVIPYLSDAECLTQQDLQLSDGSEAFFAIRDGQTSQTKTLRIPVGASRESRFSITYLDLNSLYQVSGSECLKDIVLEDGEISESGNLDGMSQCVNAAVTQYLPAFGEDALIRCFENNGSPCDSNNNGYSCGGDPTAAGCTDYNPIYDNRLGCLMCTLNIEPECSSDNFAIRPEHFEIDIEHRNQL